VAGNFSLRRRVQTDSGSHPASYPMGIRALSLGVKRREGEADHSPSSSTEVKNAWSWTIGVLGIDPRRGLGIFLFTTASRTSLGPTQPPIQWVPGALFLGVKWPGREDNHSPPYSAEVREFVELYIYCPNTPSWRGA
jgi:hypothetical protein